MLQDTDWAWHWPSIDPLVQLGPQAMEKPIYADLQNPKGSGTFSIIDYDDGGWEHQEKKPISKETKS